MQTTFLILNLLLMIVILMLVYKIFKKQKEDITSNYINDITIRIKTFEENIESNIIKQNAQTKEVIDLQNINMATKLDSIGQNIQANLNQSLKDICLFIKEEETSVDNLNKQFTKDLINLKSSIDKSNELTENRSDKLYEQIESNIKTIREISDRNEERNAKNFKELSQEVKHNLDMIKNTVDQQLQDTLDKKLKSSFDSVMLQMTNVQKSLGEMTALSNDVIELKKTLSNVKNRGILGEVILGNLIDDILTPAQYEKNVATVKTSNERVEYAIKFPGSDGETVLMPVDSKFPADTYRALMDAYDSGNKTLISEKSKLLATTIKNEAKDIKNKYIHVPDTTAFGIMFLPSEGLYAEVLRLGIADELNKNYHVMVAGPTTFCALLNSLQVGFKTLEIQKHSDEIRKVLSEIKTEFITYQDTVEKVYKDMNRVNTDFENLVRTRTNQMNKKLSKIETIECSENDNITK